MEKNFNLKRRLELSSKFLEMGQALLKEGSESKDYCITQSGSFMILIGGLIVDEEDIYDFSQLCAMFSSKKLLDSLEQSKSDLTEYLKSRASKETYDELIKKINKLRGDNGEPPLI